jgi:hypothetical protein
MPSVSSVGGASSSRTPIVTDGLVLHLDAGSKASYPGSGTTWYDLSSSGLNGTLTNSPTFNSAGYFRFTYTSFNYVSFPYSSAVEFLNRDPYTIEVWVYPTRNPTASGYTGIINREGQWDGARNGYNLFFLGSAGTTTFFYNENFRTSSSTGNVVQTSPGAVLSEATTLNQWVHVVATYDGTTQRMYINASTANTSSSTPGTNTIRNQISTFEIARRGAGSYFDGRIAHVRVYKKALSATEVTQNYTATKARFGL